MARRLKPDDADLWRRAMEGVARLPGRPPAPSRSMGEGRGGGGFSAPYAAVATDTSAGSSLPGLGTPAPARGRPGAPPSRPRAFGSDHPADFAGIDRRNAERLRRGRYPVEARLDLHGLTQEEAHRALSEFVASRRAAGKRCVLVITGHGHSSGGILKSAAPRWLAEPSLRRHVLALAPARPQHGGAGALYVLLRRPDRPR
jgi:DNA-nicking Smr family endonuclease